MNLFKIFKNDQTTKSQKKSLDKNPHEEQKS